MTDKELEKYFNLLIPKIKNTREFNVLKTLKVELNDLNLDPKEKDELAKSIANFGINKGFVDVINTLTGWYKLTDKGIKLKDSKLSLQKFLKKESNKPLTRFEKYTLVIAVISVLVNFFQGYYNDSVTSERDFLKSQLDSCNTYLIDMNDKPKLNAKKKSP